MIFDTIVKIYETDIVKEFKEKISVNFCKEYCISAIKDISIHHGKIYGDVPKYSRDDFVCRYS